MILHKCKYQRYTVQMCVLRVFPDRVHSRAQSVWRSSPCHQATPTPTSCQDDKLTSPGKVNNKVVHPQTLTVTFRNGESQVRCSRNKVIRHFDTPQWRCGTTAVVTRQQQNTPHRPAELSNVSTCMMYVSSLLLPLSFPAALSPPSPPSSPGWPPARGSPLCEVVPLKGSSC